jgi:4-amino-4-deoxy-L-arabinose transferase-like glycosyltransferase
VSAPSIRPAASSPAPLDWAAIAILLLALVFRLYRLDAPFVEGHSWRQVSNADIARNWVEGPIDFFYPTVSWGGADGRVGFEFPLLFLLNAVVWRVTGVSDLTGRAVPAAFSLATVWLLYRLGTRLLGAPSGRAAAFLFAVSPSVVFFGRAMFSDTLMLAFSVAAVLGYVSYAQTHAWPAALGGAVALALAGLVKLPAVLLLGPLAVIAWFHRGTSWWRDPWYVAAPLAAVGAVGLWYLHADQIFLETGLTAAIFRPSGTYPSDIAQWAGPFRSVSHWTRADLLTWETAAVILDRFVTLHITPTFAVLVGVGFLRWHWPLRARLVIDVWTLAAFSLIAVSLEGQLAHEFHQLPALPPLALYFGMGAAPLFDSATYVSLRRRTRHLVIATSAILLTWVGVRGFVASGVVAHLYRPNALNTPLVNAGAAMAAHTPPHALFVTVEYERYGSNSPMLLYYAHRRGWSFDATSISAEVIAYLHASRGACYVAVTDWPTLRTVRPDVVEYLRPYPRVHLPDTHEEYQLVDLGCGRPRDATGSTAPPGASE